MYISLILSVYLNRTPTFGCFHLFLKQTSFPLPEFIMAAGFFTVLIMERIVLNCRQDAMQGSDQEGAPLMRAKGHSHGQGKAASTNLEGSAHHVHMDLQAHSSFRSFMLFFSLSLHSVFEGLAIGLQTTDSKVGAGERALLKLRNRSISFSLPGEHIRPFRWS